MLTEFYIEALLVDEGLADQVWGLGMMGRLMIWLPGWAGGSLQNLSSNQTRR